MARTEAASLDPESATAAGAVAPSPASIEGFDLSPQQRRIWVLARHGGGAFRSWCVVSIRGPLSRAELQAALGRIVERHEVLRTSFRSLPGLPTGVQVVARGAAAAVADCDLQSCPAPERARLLAEVAERSRTVPFDLAGGPSMRAWLVTLAPGRQLLYLALPSLLMDAVALHNLVRELADELGGRPGADEPPVQYADAAAAFNQLLDGDGAARGRKFWRRNAPAEPAAGWLACEEQRPPQEAFALQKVGRELAPAAVAQVFGRRPESRPEDLLLGCWAALLWRLGGGPDLMLGVAAAGRAFEGLDRALGLYARRVPLRWTVDPAISFAELATTLAAKRAVGEQWAELFSWDDGEAFLPYGFEYHELPQALSAGPLELSVEESRACVDRHRLEASCQRHRDGLRIDLWFDPHHLGRVPAQRLLDQYLALVEDAAAAPGRRLREVAALHPGARHQLLVEWNDTAAAAPEADCLHHLVALQGRRAPEGLAVVGGAEHWSLAGLLRTAAALAGTLRAAGVAPGVVVGLLAERSPSMLSGMLGILAAGGAYLPLDPALPGERRSFQLEDAGARLMVAGPGFSHRRPEGYRGEVLPITAEVGGSSDLAAVEARVSPGDPAYVIYTSGSTGRPKGVVIPHGAIVNRLWWMQRRFPVGPDDRLLQRTSCGFDASIWEIFIPLLSGAALVLADPSPHQDAHHLTALAARERVTVLQLVPSLLQVLLGGGELEACTSLKRLFCGGEALTTEVAERFARRTTAELCNLYGPTEVAIDATCWPCRLGVGSGVVPIGRPLDNVRVYVVGAGLTPQPMAQPGELVVGGAGVASRYLRRPRLTAERFIPDPFGPAAGCRLYRTGDVARRRPDGALEFLGRRDDQVKLRGFRIEPGEVEATLAAHPGIRQTAVAVRQTSAGDLRLVAYVVPRPGVEADQESWRRYLAERLPEYMVPAVFVPLDGLPRSPSGKVDRRSLPAPPDSSGVAYRPPRTPTQEVLAACFAELLGLERVGLDEDFFASGGHSLLGTQLVARVREVFGTALSLRALFESPTVEALAGRIDAGRLAGEGITLPPLEPLPRGGHLPLSFAQARLWFLDQMKPGTATFNLPAAVRLAGPLDASALDRSLHQVIRRHESLRTTFTERDGQPCALLDAGRPFRLCLVDLSGLLAGDGEEAVRNLVQREVGRPFDLARGPLLRGVLFRLAPEAHVVAFTLHHVVGDAWSTSILIREVSALYPAFRGGEPAVLPELPIQYADFAHWQRRCLAGERLEQLVAYWRRRLAAAGRPLSLPRDHDPPAASSGRGHRRQVRVADELAQRLRALSRSEGCTLFMVLLAGFQALLSHYTGREDAVVGTDVANRGRSEAESLIGLFVNELVLRTDLSGDPSFRELLGRVRGGTLDAYDHQDLPFEKLVEVLNPSRDRDAQPLFQTKLVLQNVERVQLELSDLALSVFDFQGGTGQLDCIINLEDSANGLFGGLDYRSDLYDAETIDHYWSQYQRLLAAAAADPEEPLSRLFAPLAEADRQHREARRRTQLDSRRQGLRAAARRAVRRG
jgi:amino acid adenylation domain-containing protein